MIYKSFNSIIGPDMGREKLLSVDNKMAKQPKFSNRVLDKMPISKQKSSLFLLHFVFSWNKKNESYQEFNSVAEAKSGVPMWGDVDDLMGQTGSG